MALCDGGLRQGGTMAGFVSLDGLFAGRHFDREIIILCVRWYLRFKLRVLLQTLGWAAVR
jgi:hypothetical protein